MFPSNVIPVYRLADQIRKTARQAVSPSPLMMDSEYSWMMCIDRVRNLITQLVGNIGSKAVKGRWM